VTAAAQPADISAILGLLATKGPRSGLLLGPGAPAELSVSTDNNVLTERELIDAAKACQNPDGSCVIVVGTGAATRSVLDQPEISRACLLIVGTGAADNRAALEALPWLSWTRVRHVDLEYVPPRVIGSSIPELSGGLGLVIVDADPETWTERTSRFVPMARLLPDLVSAWVPARMSAELIEEGRSAQAELAAITSSASWQITAPLRAVKNRLRRNVD
jgi:hypothetical protein